MPRTSGNSTQQIASSNMADNPPFPSTIAAQIVNNAANVNGHQESGTKIPFPELLQEFLGNPIIDDRDPQLNVQFISTIVEAGLDALHQPNPFALDQPKILAIDSIRAIKISICQIPQLLVSYRTDRDDGHPEPPVFLWLFPKLLGLLDPTKFEVLQEHVQDLLTTCLSTLGRITSLWPYEASLFDLYRSSVEGILVALQTPDEPAQLLNASCDIIIPPLSSISSFWPESQKAVALPHGCQINIMSRLQAVFVGLQIMQALLGPDKGRKFGQNDPTSSRPSLPSRYLPWALDCCLSLWEIAEPSCSQVGRGAWNEAIEQVFMEILDAAALPLISSEEDVPYSLNAATTLSVGLSGLIKAFSTTYTTVPNEICLASSLVKLRDAIEGLSEVRSTGKRVTRSLKHLITDNMAPVILDVCQSVSKLDRLHKDLQLALCLWTSTGDWPDLVNNLRKELCSDEVGFRDVEIREGASFCVKQFKDLNLSDDEPAAKRRRVTTEPHRDDTPALYSHLRNMVTGHTEDSPVDLSAQAILDMYDGDNQDHDGAVDSSEKRIQHICEFLSALGKMACAASEGLEPGWGPPTNWNNATCRFCDSTTTTTGGSKQYWDQSTTDEDWVEVVAALLEIAQRPDFRESKKPRIYMALAIKRVFNHISQAAYRDLEEQSLGEWLLASMSRSLRELRIAAGQALMVFLQNDVPQPVRGKNRMLALEFFHTLSQKDTPSIHETLILAYGQAARVCGEDELPIILLQLVEYLGHTNALICGVAYNELASIAEAFNKKPAELLRPYWRIIGVAVCNDLRNKPQKAQHLSDLTEQTVTNLLLSSQADILPHLVLTKRKDILEQIAKARGSSVQDVCIQPQRHLANILALLLCQPVRDVEQNAMDTLIAASSAFGETGYDLADYVKYEPVVIACEILKAAADQHESKKQQYKRGFETLAALAEVRSDVRNGPRRATQKKKTLETFFDLHLLGIMAHFSEILDSVVNHPLVEKKRCVGAISEMITIAGNSVSSALPQIRACLQSAMADPQLCDQTFLVWTALIAVLDEEGLEQVIDQTFALIAQNWDLFSEDTQVKARDFLMDLIKNNNKMLRERIGFIPSLASISMLSKMEGQLSQFKDGLNKVSFFKTFAQRVNDENGIVVRHALRELEPFLEANQKILHEAAISEKPFPALPALTRSLLDASVRFSEDCDDIPILCARCLGLVGGLDPYKVETVREKKHILVLSNFERLDEVIDFCAFLLERVLVKVFHSTTNARAQGFLAYVMQELLRACGFNSLTVQKPRASQARTPALKRWLDIPETVRNTLTPFLNSRYLIRGGPNKSEQHYPIFAPGVSHSSWLRAFVFDLLQKGKGDNARMVFTALARIIHRHDLSIPTFILPFAVLNLIITGDERDTANIGQELLTVLQSEVPAGDQTEALKIKQCSENVFQTLDYLALWLTEKRMAVTDARTMAGRTGRGISETEEIKDIAAISCVEGILQLIPAEIISRRAVECGSYARALYHWEQYYRQERTKAEDKGSPFEKDELMQHLQFIYAQIDEPDSLEGISAHLQVLNPEQQIMEHRKAGRWTAAQSWYELSLAEKPDDTETQINLLTALKESGQYDSILNHVDGFRASKYCSPSALPFAVEAAWSTGRWQDLERVLASTSEHNSCTSDFNVGVGRALLALRSKEVGQFKDIVEALRAAVAKDLSPTSTVSLHACHDNMIKLHALYEIESLSGVVGSSPNRADIIEHMDRRLDILGAYTSDKHYLLGVRRAVMQLSRIEFTKLDIAAAWLTTARLARKGDFMSTAFNAVLHAAKLGDDASKIEYSKLLWKEGHHRKAIQNLHGAIENNSFQSRDAVPIEQSLNTAKSMDQSGVTNKVKSHAQLLLAKWLDRSGQTKSIELKDAYANGLMSYPRWDKGHYYLGRHYLMLRESEEKLPADKQSMTYRAGEYNKLIIENYIRSVVYGTKYYYQTIPKILTLWLDFGQDVLDQEGKARTPREKEIYNHKANFLDTINKHIQRYSNERMPAYSWYTAFPQIITRVNHPQSSVWDVLAKIIVKVVLHYPQQAMWSILPVTKATQDDRRRRGNEVLTLLRTDKNRQRFSMFDVGKLIAHGQRITDALLSACDAHVEKRFTHVSLSKDLGFNMKLTPCQLVIPIEAMLVATLPNTIDSKAIRSHKPFPQDAVTIASFQDDVLVLSSLMRPRKLTVRGSDGKSYGLLCKPKDDLRKDQRLMEFNTMINRALKSDIESSKRRLYIKTYAVTPLNEECGAIEWIEGLKPLRDIILRNYKGLGITINYEETRALMTKACSDISQIHYFTKHIMGKYPPVLYAWFIEAFPEPEAWFAARLRYTRTCAVMSICGHVLGLGDRHGENILFEEGNGGILHVDFNCLFDKGLTFEKPEMVPFRLTENMVDAMGPQGVEGPFRKAAELTYAQLRQHEDTLLTILETFVHDPTADFIGRVKRKKIPGVPDTPQEILQIVKAKVDGIMKGETVPLSVEGYVDHLIAAARDPMNLASMYIGWCAFF